MIFAKSLSSSWHRGIPSVAPPKRLHVLRAEMEKLLTFCVSPVQFGTTSSS